LHFTKANVNSTDSSARAEPPALGNFLVVVVIFIPGSTKNKLPRTK